MIKIKRFLVKIYDVERADSHRFFEQKDKGYTQALVTIHDDSNIITYCMMKTTKVFTADKISMADYISKKRLGVEEL